MRFDLLCSADVKFPRQGPPATNIIPAVMLPCVRCTCQVQQLLRNIVEQAVQHERRGLVLRRSGLVDRDHGPGVPTDEHPGGRPHLHDAARGAVLPPPLRGGLVHRGALGWVPALQAPRSRPADLRGTLRQVHQVHARCASVHPHSLFVLLFSLFLPPASFSILLSPSLVVSRDGVSLEVDAHGNGHLHGPDYRS